jgi:hypothetical protein
MAKRVSAGWHVSASAGDHPRPALLGLNDTLLGVLSWLGSRDVARLRRVCRELRDCGESRVEFRVEIVNGAAAGSVLFLESVRSARGHQKSRPRVEIVNGAAAGSVLLYSKKVLKQI